MAVGVIGVTPKRHIQASHSENFAFSQVRMHIFTLDRAQTATY